MKGCCNVRLLSYIVAVFHLVVYALTSIILLASMVMYFQPNTQYGKDEEDFRDIPFRRFVILFIVSVATFIVSIILIRGIKLNRTSLIIPFLICMAVITGINIAHEIISFIVSLVKKEPFGSAIVTFVVGCIVMAIEIALLTPVYLFYKNLKTQQLTSRPKIPNDFQPEENGNTIHGGQI